VIELNNHIEKLNQLMENKNERKVAGLNVEQAAKITPISKY
jgi:hypothetical protein